MESLSHVGLARSTICLYNQGVAFVWDPDKAKVNFRKHGVRFSTEALAIFGDDFALTVSDDESDPAERRFITLGMGALGRVLVAVYCYRGDDIRIISARPAEPHERKDYETQR